MRDFSKKCNVGMLAFIAKGEFAGWPVEIIEIGWHHVKEGFTWHVGCSLGNLFVNDACLTPIADLAQYKGEGK